MAKPALHILGVEVGSIALGLQHEGKSGLVKGLHIIGNVNLDAAGIASVWINGKALFGEVHRHIPFSLQGYAPQLHGFLPGPFHCQLPSAGSILPGQGAVKGNPVYGKACVIFWAI